ncbi:(2Fe-2S)-binding protein [Aeromicrobium terrae]|uniref:(2Fe-2S)-binding protein n=1 Tax=Aeromicrobium terrae TaxID=2498846 RepID=A0A5C8NLV6_9ACTN|nr:(2Fe-2S)-binding protein [Aeromicrobium terrae]TXL62070.1 (2Fe-2S)-binding protein [Aeromicrobium terrae]
MIVCHCGVVTSGDIAEAMIGGARTVGEVCRRTGAAQSCGTCYFSVRQVVCQHEQHAQPVAEEAVRAAS